MKTGSIILRSFFSCFDLTNEINYLYAKYRLVRELQATPITLLQLFVSTSPEKYDPFLVILTKMTSLKREQIIMIQIAMKPIQRY